MPLSLKDYPSSGVVYSDGSVRYPLMILWCAIGWIAIAWIVIITAIFSIYMANYPNNAKDIERQDLNNLIDLFDEFTVIDDGVQQDLDILDDNSECIDGLCGVNSTALPRLLSSMTDAGCWDASTNTPTLVSGTGTPGTMYIVCVAGTKLLDGNNMWFVDDILFFLEDAFNGDRWVRYGPAAPFLNDSSGVGQTLIINGTPTVYEMYQLGVGGTKLDIESDGATITLSLSDVAREEQIRTYSTLNGTTNVFDYDNFASSPEIASEHWIRRGDLLSGYLVMNATLNATGINSVTLRDFPVEILNEIGGVNQNTTLTDTSVWCDAHRTFSTGTNDDYDYLLRTCYVGVGVGPTQTVSVYMEGEITNIGAGVVGPVKLMLNIVFDSLVPFGSVS